MNTDREGHDSEVSSAARASVERAMARICAAHDAGEKFLAMLIDAASDPAVWSDFLERWPPESAKAVDMSAIARWLADRMTQHRA